jgi:hypothetical protein
MGVYFGLAYNEVEYWFDHDIDYTGLPLISLKYYLSDKNVIRIGLQTSKTSEKAVGKVDPLVDGTTLTEKNYVDKNSKFLFSPGFEHHFTSSNILDVYVGGVIPFGFRAEEYTNDEVYSSGNYSKYTRTFKSFTYGYEAFIGMQAFVADLPLAFGVDFGIAGLGHLKTVYKHDLSQKFGTVSTNQTYYTPEMDFPGGTKYKSLTSSDSKFQGNIRLTVSYFFKR